MPQDEMNRIDLKRAFSRIAAEAAPREPDIDRALSRAPALRRAARFRVLRLASLPAAAAIAIAFGGALLYSRFSAREASPSLGSDYLLSSARDQASAATGLSPFSPDESLPATGLEADLLSYLEQLWSSPSEDPARDGSI